MTRKVKQLEYQIKLTGDSLREEQQLTAKLQKQNQHEQDTVLQRDRHIESLLEQLGGGRSYIMVYMLRLSLFVRLARTTYKEWQLQVAGLNACIAELEQERSQLMTNLDH